MANEKTFGAFIGNPPLAISLGKTVADIKFLEAKYPQAIKSPTKVGIEIECENVRQEETTADLPKEIHSLYSRAWVTKEDGSLRNNGMEFVTTLGMTAAQASQALLLLEDVLAHYYPNIQGNARTGVHIHLDFTERGAEELGSFTALYCLFENSLFKFSGWRKKNIFAVPVRECTSVIPQILRQARKGRPVSEIYRTCANSAKYLAFNVLAIRTFGTVELRSGAGTNKPSTVIPWLRVLVHLYDFAMSQKYEDLLRRITALNTNSEYEALMKEALPYDLIQKVGHHAVVQDMIQGCTFLKESLIEPSEINAPQNTEVMDRFDDVPDIDDPPRQRGPLDFFAEDRPRHGTAPERMLTLGDLPLMPAVRADQRGNQSFPWQNPSTGRWFILEGSVFNIPECTIRYSLVEMVQLEPFAVPRWEWALVTPIPELAQDRAGRANAALDWARIAARANRPTGRPVARGAARARGPRTFGVRD